MGQNITIIIQFSWKIIRKKKKSGIEVKTSFYNTKNDQILIIYGISSLAIVSYYEEVSNTQKIVYFRIIESR